MAVFDEEELDTLRQLLLKLHPEDGRIVGELPQQPQA
jgi:hypothetical protein